jgi:hypothetical protein
MYMRTADGLGETAPQLRLAPYSPPYENIRLKMPSVYPAALAALSALNKLVWFKDVYMQLQAAAANAHLALNQADEIVVVLDEAATTTLLGEKVVKAVLKQAGKSVFKQLINEDFGRFLGILDLLYKTLAALSTYDAKRLVNEQRGSRFEEAFRYKLRFVIGLYIARWSPRADRARLGWTLEQKFFEYRKAQSEVWKYDTMDRNLRAGLPPNAREPARMYAR